MQFQVGDQVTVTHPHAEHPGDLGKTGVVKEVHNGLVCVKGIQGGIRGRVLEVVVGVIAYYPTELTKG